MSLVRHQTRYSHAARLDIAYAPPATKVKQSVPLFVLLHVPFGLDLGLDPRMNNTT